MNETTAEIIDLNEQRNNRSLRLLKGGSGPPGYTGGNWLAGLQCGQRFLCKDKTIGGSELKDCIVASNFDVDNVMIGFSFKGRDGYFEWHDSATFSNNHTLRLLMETVDVSNKLLLKGPVESHGDAEEQPGIHETE